MDDYVYWGVIAVLALTVILCIRAIVRLRREKKAVDGKLIETTQNLDDVYSEINTTQEELNSKYRELKTSEDKIKKLAYEDAMTGLPNKAAFMEVLEHTLSTLRKNESIAVMHIDLDNFKEINDLWGEPLGDELILDISHRIKQNLDENDFLAKSSSDEFFILTQNIENADDYELRVKRLQKALRFPFILSVNEFIVTVSMGIVMAPRNGKTLQALMKHADSALNEAKWIGKNTYCYYSDKIEQRELEELELKTAMTAAINSDEFFAVYQPVADLEKGSRRAIRVSLRWNRGEKGIWRAGRFIRFAEATGQTIMIGERVLRQACEHFSELLKEDPDLMMVVPLTKRQFINVSFETTIRDIIGEFGLKLSSFIFEISEKTAYSNFEDYKFLMAELTKLGFKFRLGEFGSGMMSLKALSEFTYEEIGISLMGLFEEHSHEDGMMIFNEITDIARKLDKTVIVCDVDDPVVEKNIIDMGLRFVQGELYEFDT